MYSFLMWFATLATLDTSALRRQYPWPDIYAFLMMSYSIFFSEFRFVSNSFADLVSQRRQCCLDLLEELREIFDLTLIVARSKNHEFQSK
jgi:hypothetical protein